jgi:hypothetical protein
MDERQLRFVYEKDLLALPTIATVLASPAFWMKAPEFGLELGRYLIRTEIEPVASGTAAERTHTESTQHGSKREKTNRKTNVRNSAQHHAKTAQNEMPQNRTKREELMLTQLQNRGFVGSSPTTPAS